MRKSSLLQAFLTVMCMCWQDATHAAPPTVAVKPAAPIIGSATAGNASATVTFSAPSNDGGSPITHYTATSAPGVLTASSAGSPITVVGLSNGTSYTFSVTATNAIGTGPASEPSNSVTPSGPLPDATPPTSPGTLSPTSSTPNSVNLQWAASTDSGGSGLAGYQLERCVGLACTSFSQIAATSATSYSDTGLNASTTYGYRVRAYDNAGNQSDYSNIATVTTGAAGGTSAPVALVSAVSYDQSMLHFADGYIYFGERAGSFGTLSRVPIDGGPKEIIASNATVIDSGNYSGIVRIDSSPTHLYFSYGGYQTTVIEELRKDLTGRRVVATTSGGLFLGLYGADIHLVRDFCCIEKLAIAPGSVEQPVASGLWPRSEYKDAGALYFVDWYSRDLYRYEPLANLSPSSILGGNPSEGAPHVNGSSVFVALDGFVRWVSKAGGGVSTITLPTGAYMRGADDENIYFVVNNTGLWKQSLAGGPPQLVDAGAIVANRMYRHGAYIYWVDTRNGAANAAIYRLATNSSADLGVSVVPPPAPAYAGKDMIYTLSAANAGPSGTSAIITFPLSAGTMFVWASPGCSNTAGAVTCAIGTLEAGGSASFKIVIRPSTTGTITNTFSISGAAADPNAANNSSSHVAIVSATGPGAPTLRYRLYSPASLEHHFTTDLNEYTVLGASGHWIPEGTVGRVLDNPGSYNSVAALPYYRLYNTFTLWHHWTTDPNEYYTLITFPGWNGEGVDGYLLPSATTGATPLYRLVYPNGTGLHHWTTDANEYTTLVGVYGWVGEGGTGFVLQ